MDTDTSTAIDAIDRPQPTRSEAATGDAIGAAKQQAAAAAGQAKRQASSLFAQAKDCS